MENIIESYLPYIDKELFSAILDKVDQLSFNKSGLNSKCSIVGNYAILRTDNITGHDDSFIRIINSLHELKQKGINVVPILGFGILKKGMPFASGKRFDSGYIIQEKAEGQELLCPNVLRGKTDEDCRVIVKEYLDMLRNAPQEHFNKWLSDFKEIGASNISIDPSKESNFFYDKDKGFSFIDLNFFDDVKKEDNRHRIDFIQYSFTPFNRFFRGQYDRYFQNAEDMVCIDKIKEELLEKYIIASNSIGISKEDVIYALEQWGIKMPNHIMNTTDDMENASI